MPVARPRPVLDAGLSHFLVTVQAIFHGNSVNAAGNNGCQWLYMTTEILAYAAS